MTRWPSPPHWGSGNNTCPDLGEQTLQGIAPAFLHTSSLHTHPVDVHNIHADLLYIFKKKNKKQKHAFGKRLKAMLMNILRRFRLGLSTARTARSEPRQSEWFS